MYLDESFIWSLGFFSRFGLLLFENRVWRSFKSLSFPSYLLFPTIPVSQMQNLLYSLKKSLILGKLPVGTLKYEREVFLMKWSTDMMFSRKIRNFSKSVVFGCLKVFSDFNSWVRSDQIDSRTVKFLFVNYPIHVSNCRLEHAHLHCNLAFLKKCTIFWVGIGRNCECLKFQLTKMFSNVARILIWNGFVHFGPCFPSASNPYTSKLHQKHTGYFISRIWQMYFNIFLNQNEKYVG